LKIDDLNALLTDASTFDRGNNQGFLGSNLVLGMWDAPTKKYLIELSQKMFGLYLIRQYVFGTFLEYFRQKGSLEN